MATEKQIAYFRALAERAEDPGIDVPEFSKLPVEEASRVISKMEGTRRG